MGIHLAMQSAWFASITLRHFTSFHSLRCSTTRATESRCPPGRATRWTSSFSGSASSQAAAWWRTLDAVSEPRRFTGQRERQSTSPCFHQDGFHAEFCDAMFSLPNYTWLYAVDKNAPNVVLLFTVHNSRYMAYSKEQGIAQE